MSVKRRQTLIGLCLLLGAAQVGSAYQLFQRWTITSQGFTGSLGDPVTLTWSIVDDATPIPQLGSSDLVSYLDNIFPGGSGSDISQRPWFSYYKHAFDRWSELGGITYVYEPQDDGAAVGNFPGLAGVRGDIRLSGTYIDGPSGFRALGQFPNHGDMVLDTGEGSYFANQQLLQTVVLHEQGHSFGLTHVYSDDASLIMEVNDLNATGPQIDDIRGLHRAYGDVLEKSHDGAGNDRISEATWLGHLTSNNALAIGTDGHKQIVDDDDVDFVSIDDTFDLDFFAFQIDSPLLLDALLTPVGPTYLEGAQQTTQRVLDASAISNLSLSIMDQDGFPIEMANTTGIGEAEQIRGLELSAAGQYYAVVSGTADDVQLYQLELSGVLVPEPSLFLGGLLGLAVYWQWRRHRFFPAM